MPCAVVTWFLNIEQASACILGEHKASIGFLCVIRVYVSHLQRLVVVQKMGMNRW